MPYPRGYRIYEPIDYQNLDPTNDRLVAVLVENGSGTIAGAEYYNSSATTITWTENTSKSTFLTSGLREYRYIVPFDDENVGSPSLVYSLLNLTPPTDLTITSIDYDTVRINFTNVDGANEYTIKFKKLLDNSVIEQVIANNENVLGLEANTGYEVSMKATNGSNESTIYSVVDPAFVTLKYFALTGTPISKGIVWDIDYSLDGNTAYFEIIKETGELVADLGSSTDFTQSDIPVDTYRCYARLHNYDFTIRDTKVYEAVVYQDVQEVNIYNDIIYNEVDELIGISGDEYIYHDYGDIFEYEDALTNENNTDGYLAYEQPWRDWIFESEGFIDEEYYKFERTQNATEISITNENILNDYIYNQGSFNDFTGNYATNTIITNNYNYITKLEFSNYNSYKDSTPYEMEFSSIVLNTLFPVTDVLLHDYKSVFSLENLNYTQSKDSFQHQSAFSQTFIDITRMTDSLYNDYKQSLNYQNDIGKDFRYILDGLKIGIGNEHYIGTTPPRFVYSNDYTLPITRARDAFYNPIIPKDINNKDIVWNQINKDVNLVSQVNRVRILCVGDSITAG